MTRTSPSYSKAKTTWIWGTSWPSSPAQVEEVLVATAAPIVRIYRLKGGHRGYEGHVANGKQNVGDLLTRLPRVAVDVLMLFVCHQGHDDGTHKDFLARKYWVLDALGLLRPHKPNYQNVEIDNAAVQVLPEDGQLAGPSGHD